MFAEARQVIEAAAAGTGRDVTSVTLACAEPSGDGVLAGYDVELSTPRGDGEQVRLFIDTASLAPSEGADERSWITVRNPDSGEQVRVWRYPHDPALPALPATAYRDSAKEIAHRFGAVGEGQLEMLAYRPGRRAVLRLAGDQSAIFFKVVRPRQAEPLHRIHEELTAAGINVPRSRGWSETGLVALDRVPGRPADSRLPRSQEEREQFLGGLRDLMVSIAGATVTRDARPSLTSGLSWYRKRVLEALPARDADIWEIAARVQLLLESAAPGPRRTVHGDLHLGQIFVDPDARGTITGVVDVDTAGVGDLADDLGALYAHAIVTALTFDQLGQAGSRDATFALAELVRGEWGQLDAHADPDLQVRATAVALTHLLSHAFGASVRGGELLTELPDRILDFALAFSRGPTS